MDQLALEGQANQTKNGHMTTNWISRLGSGLAFLFGFRPGECASPELDADLRRMRSELDAIRMRFPDHS
ncbi:hypothetical protein [Mycolicibacterium baixiangningiae]|uniref:hypothetical protein n=1 Tax=Mycolicibacterium baixiangningiae TaxID=2761578 RepID=UPI0018D02251|nr:hypothetical protein [Mycolicibacterium baixiangningiae]